MNRVPMIVLGVVVALGTSGCGGGGSSKSPDASQRQLTNLHNISQLQTAFTTASDQPRLIVLVSPT
jgi:hypothetical protein